MIEPLFHQFSAPEPTPLKGLENEIGPSYHGLKPVATCLRPQGALPPPPGRDVCDGMVQALGFRKEGYSPRYLKIGGRWRDHERWALLVEEWRS